MSFLDIRIERMFFIGAFCFASVQVCKSPPPLPIPDVSFPGRKHRSQKRPSGPLSRERLSKEAIAGEFSCAGYVTKRRLRKAVVAHAEANKAEEASLRRFVVRSDAPGDDKFARAARIVAGVSAASVSVYKVQEAEADGIRAEMDAAYARNPRRESDALAERGFFVMGAASDSLKMPVDPEYLRLKALLGERARAAAAEILRQLPAGSQLVEDDTNGGAFVVLMRDQGVVLKFPNPYNSYHWDIVRREDHGVLGENHSLKRQVRRVSAAAAINLECGPRGVRAPEKRLCLRPGAELHGPMNDRYLVVIAEFKEKKADPGVGGYGRGIRFEQIDQFQRVTDFARTIDFHDGNVWRDAASDDLLVMDTEENNAYLSPNRAASIATLPFEMHPRVQSYCLMRSMGRHWKYFRSGITEMDHFLDSRVEILWNCARHEVEKAASRCSFRDRDHKKVKKIMRDWLPEYLQRLTGEGLLTQVQARKIQYFWMGPDVDTFFEVGSNVYNRICAMKNEPHRTNLEAIEKGTYVDAAPQGFGRQQKRCSIQ